MKKTTLLLGSAAVCCILATGFAVAAMEYPFHVSDVVGVERTAGGAKSVVRLAGRNAAGAAVTATRSIGFSGARLGGLARVRSFSPYGLALQAAIIGAGLILDEGTQEVKDPGEPEPWSDTQSGSCWKGGTGFQGNMTYEACLDSATATWSILNGGAGYWSQGYGPGGVANQTGMPCTNGCVRKGDRSTTTPRTLFHWSPIDDVGIDEPFDPDAFEDTVATDQEIYDRVLSPESSYSESWKMGAIRNLMYNPAQGRPDPALSEHAAAATDATTDLDAFEDADPLTNPTTDSLYDVGVDNVVQGEVQASNPPTAEMPETETVPEEPHCTEAPNSLGCVDTTEALAAVAIGAHAIDPGYSPISFAGSAVCPPPPSVVIDGQTYEFNNQPVCDLLDAGRPVLLIVFSIFGLMAVSRGLQS